jgi:hypothetical protein
MSRYFFFYGFNFCQKDQNDTFSVIQFKITFFVYKITMPNVL